MSKIPAKIYAKIIKKPGKYKTKKKPTKVWIPDFALKNAKDYVRKPLLKQIRKKKGCTLDDLISFMKC